MNMIQLSAMLIMVGGVASSEFTENSDANVANDVYKGRLGKGHSSSGCHNLHDAKILKDHGEKGVEKIVWHCADTVFKKSEPRSTSVQHHELDDCVQKEIHPSKGFSKLSRDCAECFGSSIMCGQKNCLLECGTRDKKCDDCMKKKCKGGLDKCTKFKSAAADTFEDEDIVAAIHHGHHNGSHHNRSHHHHNDSHRHNKSHHHHNESHHHHNKSHQHHNKSHGHHNESHHHHHNKSHHHNESHLLVTGGGCHNIHDGLILKAHGKHRVNTDVWHCADDLAKKEPHSDHEKREKLDHCINDKFHEAKGKNKGKLSKDCVGCFADSVLCAEKKCLEECGKHGHKCDDCMKKKCKGGFDKCSHLKSVSFADLEEDTTTAQRAFFI